LCYVFFFFLIFVLLSEKGQLSTYLYQISIEQNNKIKKFLLSRSDMTKELIIFLDKSILEIKKITLGYDSSYYDLLLNLQYITKKLLINLTNSQIKTYLDIITLRSHYLSFKIKLYLNTDLFINKSFKYSYKNNKTKYLII
jgi:Rps23 Pro-64 3,4-dihydroxylase Tpa1-like proline 4-hydroxylase